MSFITSDDCRIVSCQDYRIVSCQYKSDSYRQDTICIGHKWSNTWYDLYLCLFRVILMAEKLRTSIIMNHTGWFFPFLKL